MRGREDRTPKRMGEVRRRGEVLTQSWGASQRRGQPAGAGSQHLPCFRPGGAATRPGGERGRPSPSLRFLPLFPCPLPRPASWNAAGAFKRELGYPGGGSPSAERGGGALRDAPHFLLLLPPRLPPPSPPPPPPRSVVFCSRGEKCYVRKVPGGTGWGHAPRALLQAPARSPLYEVRRGVPSSPGTGSRPWGALRFVAVGRVVALGGVWGGGRGRWDRSCAGEAWVFGKVFTAGLEGFRQPAPHGGARPGLGGPGPRLASPPDAPCPGPCPPEPWGLRGKRSAAGRHPVPGLSLPALPSRCCEVLGVRGRGWNPPELLHCGLLTP